MECEKAIEKVRKLLRLTESSSVNEAAAAAAQAQRLIEEHRIDQAMLTVVQDDGVADEIRDYDGDEALFSAKRLPWWKAQLAWVLASANACETYRTPRWHIESRSYGHCIGLIGRAGDVETVRYLFRYLSLEIERLCREASGGKGRTWANSFRLGAVAELRRRLNEARARARAEARQKAAGDSKALVRLDHALARLDHRAKEVNEWMLKHIPKMKKAPSYSSDRDWQAFQRGREAARTIELEEAEKRVGSGPKSLTEEGV